MKQILLVIFLILIWFLIVYAAFWFVTLEPNIIMWDLTTRVFYVLVSVIIGPLFCAAILDLLDYCLKEK